MRFTAVFLIAAAAGCAAEPEFASVSTAEQEVFWWHWHTETVLDDFDPYHGVPVWADDDSRAAGIELRYERRVSFPPLQGWWAKRNFSFRLFNQEPGVWAEKQYVTDWIPGRATRLHDSARQGYLLVQVWDAEAGTMRELRVDEADGSVQELVADALPRLDERVVLPSPDGAVIADVSCRLWQETPIDGGAQLDPLRPIPCTVRFVDALSLSPLGDAQVVSLPADAGWVEGPGGDDYFPGRVTWTPEGDLVVTDRNTTAFSLVPGATPQAAAVPSCVGPATTSSRIDADGRRLGVDFGKIRVVDGLTGDQPFGCP